MGTKVILWLVVLIVVLLVIYAVAVNTLPEGGFEEPKQGFNKSSFQGPPPGSVPSFKGPTGPPPGFEN